MEGSDIALLTVKTILCSVTLHCTRLGLTHEVVCLRCGGSGVTLPCMFHVTGRTVHHSTGIRASNAASVSPFQDCTDAAGADADTRCTALRICKYCSGLHDIQYRQYRVHVSANERRKAVAATSQYAVKTHRAPATTSGGRWER